MTNKLFTEPFDLGTKTKLRLFRSYLEAWIPTFVMSKNFFGDTLRIYDLFSGPGKNHDGEYGSPLLILEELNKQTKLIRREQCKIELFFNDENSHCVSVLKGNCESFFLSNPNLKDRIHIYFENQKFEDLYPSLLSQNKDGCPSLFIVDPCGVNPSIPSFINEICGYNQCDFLVFLPSAFFKRFKEHGRTQDFGLDESKLANCRPEEIHEVLVQELSIKFTKNDFSLYPFTIQKHTNYYGVIFGTKHPAAVNKFLSIAWKMDPIDGNANYSVNKDKERLPSNQLSLFEKENTLTKVEKFQKTLQNQVLNGMLADNHAIFFYALKNGHLPSHASEELLKMKKTGLLYFSSKSPLVSYNAVWKENRIVNFKVVSIK